jgi:DNA-directed RNA polymerase specialized sigma24 family protein
LGGTGTSRSYDRRGARPRGYRAAGVPYEAYYRSLVQLAALLTGDANAAEVAVAEALAGLPRTAAVGLSTDGFLRYLQRRVVVQCRRSRRAGSTARHAAGTNPADSPDDGSEFARLPVVMALRGLPPHRREAVVLTHYLDLPPAQAAAIAGVSETVLRANLSGAMQDLGDLMTGPYPDR